MLSEVNKVNKDNLIFVSFLLYFVATHPPVYFDPPPPFIMNLRVWDHWYGQNAPNYVDKQNFLWLPGFERLKSNISTSRS